MEVTVNQDATGYRTKAGDTEPTPFGNREVIGVTQLIHQIHGEGVEWGVSVLVGIIVIKVNVA